MEHLRKIASLPDVTLDIKEPSKIWFAELREKIIEAFEEIEDSFSYKKGRKPGRFIRTPWKRPGGGGGMMAIMKGNVFEKVGVNISTVWGEFSSEFCKHIPGTDQSRQFWASGISVVAHMASPLVPAVHFNSRHLVTQKSWFGGGTDLTPYFPFPKDSQDYHRALQHVCDQYNPQYYPNYKKWCDEYFYLPHRKEPRGVGGIFYDYLNSGNLEQDFAFTKDVGKTFLEIYCRIVKRRYFDPWTSTQRNHQLVRRGRYVEFNLLYDRGTLFGLKTDGNVDAILMSMPPKVKWP